jgi:outer membrane lipoprotein SlyB
VDDAGTLNEAELALSIHSVNINGRRYLVNTAAVEQSSREGIGKNRRTAEMVGGGAAIGTVIGAIAGGGKGALIGAIIGAVGGGAAQVLTKGKKVSVPAESVLTFRLDQAVRLEPAG